MSNINFETNIPELEWTDSGINLLEENKILDGVIQDFQNAFNNKLNFYDKKGKFLLSTPQGQLATSIAAIISDRNRLLAYYVNQVDPNYAMGRMQDGIGRIYFIERIPATFTEVVGICRGGVGVVIPKGTIVIDGSSNKYLAKENYTIGDNGTVEAIFICDTYGPIVCPANSLTMYQIITGWDSVTNPNAGVVGRNLESQQQFEQRRRQSVAGNSLNSVDSIMSALLNLTDNNSDPICQDAYVIDNSLGDSITNGNIILKPHSIYVCVAALDSQETQQAIAKTIWSKKPPGCAMNGTTTVTIEDKSGLYSTPPTYEMTYQYAKEVPIYFNIIMAEAQLKPSDAVAQIKKAVRNTFTGDDGSIRPRIGSQVLASSFYSGITALGSWAKIISIEIGRSTGDGPAVQMGIDEIPFYNDDNVTVRFNG